VNGPVKTIVGVPGPWADSSELVAAVARGCRGRYLYAGGLLADPERRVQAEVDLYERDARLRRAFQAAGAYSELGPGDLDAIDGHTTCAYLVDDGGGSLEAAGRMLRLASALLDAGGHAVKVESAGKVHSAGEWRVLDPASPLDLFKAFAILVGGAETGYYSCGMHNLGRPDAALPPGPDPVAAGRLLDGFLLYLLLEEPTLEDGQTFGLSADGPGYRVQLDPCVQFEPDDPFHNPFGVWRLDPIA